MINMDCDINENGSFKTIGIDINDEEFQLFFQEYFYLINKPFI